MLHDHIADPGDLAARCAGRRSSSRCGNAPVRAETFARLPDLRLLVTTGMVNAAIDLAAPPPTG